MEKKALWLSIQNSFTQIKTRFAERLELTNEALQNLGKVSFKLTELTLFQLVLKILLGGMSYLSIVLFLSATDCANLF